MIVIDVGNKTATIGDDIPRHDHETSKARAPLDDDRIIGCTGERASHRSLLTSRLISNAWTSSVPGASFANNHLAQEVPAATERPLRQLVLDDIVRFRRPATPSGLQVEFSANTALRPNAFFLHDRTQLNHRNRSLVPPQGKFAPVDSQR